MRREKTILIEKIIRWFARMSAILLSLFSLILIISLVDHIFHSNNSNGYPLILITLICLIISFFVAFFNEKLGGSMSVLFSIILIVFSNPYWIIVLYPAISILFLIVWVLSKINRETKNMIETGN